MINRLQIARTLGRTCVVLSGSFFIASVLYMLGTAKSEPLRAMMDVPMAIMFWTYTLFTPLVAGFALRLGEPQTRIVSIVKVLAALWATLALLVLLLPFLSALA